MSYRIIFPLPFPFHPAQTDFLPSFLFCAFRGSVEDFQTGGSVLKCSRNAPSVITKAFTTQFLCGERLQTMESPWERRFPARTQDGTRAGMDGLRMELWVCSWIPHNSSFQKSLSVIKYSTQHVLLIMRLSFGYLHLSSEHLPEKCSASLRRDLKASRFPAEKK